MAEAGGGSTGWSWPPDLDGPTAAPDHHRVLFENDEVRVLETKIPAGEVTPLHTHQRPTVMYVLSGSHFRRRDDTGTTVLDTRALVPPFEMPRVLWSPPLPAHTLENTGAEDVVVIGVELKAGDAAMKLGGSGS